MKLSARFNAKSVHKIMSGDRGALGALRERQARLERAAARVGELLPSPLNRHCRITAIEDGALVLHADTPAWLTRLRLERPRLLSAFVAHPEFAGLREIRLGLSPENAIQARPVSVPQTRILPSAAAAHLRATASTLSDPGLRDALLRLARRAAPGR